MIAGEVKIIFIAPPSTEVYVGGKLVGVVGIEGRLGTSMELKGTVVITASSDWYVQMGSPTIVEGREGVYVFINMVPASRVRVISNVYPVSVFFKGKYWGEVNSVAESVKLPAGEGDIVFSSPGYKPLRMRAALSWKEEHVFRVHLEEAPLFLKLHARNTVFSPNGDWYEDTLTFDVISNRPTKAVLLILKDGETLWRKEVALKVGKNSFAWDGKNDEGEDLPDGVYELAVLAPGAKDEMSVRIDRSRYTYLKECVFALAFLAVITISLVMLYMR